VIIVKSTADCVPVKDFDNLSMFDADITRTLLIVEFKKMYQLYAAKLANIHMYCLRTVGL